MKTQIYDQYPETYIRLLAYVREFAETHMTNRLPSEENLAVQLGVSRVKIRDVLSQLEAAGYVVRKRGVGTLINRHFLAERARLDIDTIYVDVVERYGLNATALVKEPYSVEPTVEMMEKLALEQGEQVYRLEKVVYGDGIPVILIADHIPARYYDSENHDRDLLERNFFHFLQTLCDDMLESSLIHVDACLAEGELSKSMEVAEGYPLMKLDSVCYNKAIEPVMCSVEYYNTKIIPFSFQKRVLTGKFKGEEPPK